MVVTEAEAQENPKEYLGRDIAISDDDIKIGSNNDFAFVTFEENLGQAIKIRLLTTVGELSNYQEYGSELPNLINQPRTADTVFKIRESVRATLLQEPRIKTIKRLTVELEDEQVHIDLEIKPINSKDTMNLVYDLFQD